MNFEKNGTCIRTTRLVFSRFFDIRGNHGNPTILVLRTTYLNKCVSQFINEQVSQ